MTYDEARDAMQAIVKGVSDTLTPFKMFYPDVTGTPPSSGAYGRTFLQHAVGRQGSLSGANATQVYDRIGTLWIQLFAPMGDGGTKGYTIGQSFVNALQAVRGSVWFRNVRLEEMGPDGAFQRFDVKATFEYTDVR